MPRHFYQNKKPKDSDNKNKLVIDVYAAGIVKEIYRMKLSGMGQTAIANAWNKQGVLSPMEYKHSLGIRIQDNFKTHEQAEWSAMSVKRILGNEVYTGTLVQRLLGIDTRTSPNEEKVYPLSGLVGCGDCGAMMIKRDVPAGGKVYAYYICSRHAATKACAAHRIPMGKLEETVLELVKIHIENILDMKKIMDFIHEVPFQELDIKELELEKKQKKRAVRCRELEIIYMRISVKESFQKKIIKSFMTGTQKNGKKPRKQSEALINRSVKSWNQKVINIIGWIILPSIRIYKNLQELLLLN